MKTQARKGNPVPVRFSDNENQFLLETSHATGLPASEVIRRGVRLLKRNRALLGGNYGFMVDLTA